METAEKIPQSFLFQYFIPGNESRSGMAGKREWKRDMQVVETGGTGTEIHYYLITIQLA